VAWRYTGSGVKLVTFFALALLVHGPLSPFLRRVRATSSIRAPYPAWLLALVGTLGASIAESVNYGWSMGNGAPEAGRALRTGAACAGASRHSGAPLLDHRDRDFLAIPDTAVRVLAHGPISLPRFLGAVALGRCPRLL